MIIFNELRMSNGGVVLSRRKMRKWIDEIALSFAIGFVDFSVCGIKVNSISLDG